MFCGGGVYFGFACRRVVVCVATGRTTFSFHWGVDVAGRVSWAPRMCVATSSLLTAWPT